MNIYFLFCLIVVIQSNTFSQPQWTPPIQITFGDGIDEHPALVTSSLYSWPNYEWLAFSRLGLKGRSIIAMKTAPGGIKWEDSLFAITDDTTDNNYPSLAKASFGYPKSKTMLVWQKKANIYYSCYSESSWSAPEPLTSDSIIDESPNIVPFDSGFGVVWIRQGSVMFSEFMNSSWSLPIQISGPSDSMNFSPKIRFLQPYGPTTPVIVWEHAKFPDTSHSILFSMRTIAGWSTIDTITSTGDNRNPNFYKVDFFNLVQISWESNRTGDWEIYTSSGQSNQDSILWYKKESNLSSNPSADDQTASFTILPIITTHNQLARTNFWFDAGTWRTSRHNRDSIVATSWSYPYNTSYFSASDTSTDRNPEISSGIFTGDFRVWTVWESNKTGFWKLFGSRIDLSLSVEEQNNIVQEFKLYQNFPNPFNPVTTIEYDVSHSSVIALKVYNMIGQEIRTLLNERKDPGHYTLQFDGSGLSSGVYFYSIYGVHFQQTRKFTILK